MGRAALIVRLGGDPSLLELAKRHCTAFLEAKNYRFRVMSSSPKVMAGMIAFLSRDIEAAKEHYPVLVKMKRQESTGIDLHYVLGSWPTQSESVRNPAVTSRSR